MTRGGIGRLALAALAVMAVFSVGAFPDIPKASAKALGVTRGKKFESGIVFINGKYLPPPYVVERWGTGLRINGRSVSGQVIDWNEFLKTQAGAKVTRTAAAPAPVAPVVEKTEEEATLDDLFDDTPKDKKGQKKKKATVRRAAAQATVSVSFDGEFLPNAQTKTLVSRINTRRTEIDRILRSGGFICFGDGYSRVTGDAGSALKLLQKVPEAQKDNESVEAFLSALRSAGLVFIPEALGKDLYRNRVDYRALMDRRSRWQADQKVESILNGAK